MATLAASCSLLLLWLLPRAGAAPGQHRVIVRFAEGEGLPAGGLSELGARPGVVKVEALPHVGLVVADCSSLQAEELLVQELEEDPSVELATPDTMLHLFSGVAGAAPGAGAAQGGGGGRPPAEEPEFRPMQDLRQCSAQSGCAALKLVGNCCPANDGLMLACCDGPTRENLVAFKSYHGWYIVAEEGGAVNVNRNKLNDWEKFQLFYNDDGSVSLLSHWGKYVGADAEGWVNATSSLIGDDERFQLIRHEDNTVSLKTTHGKYIAAEAHGVLKADRKYLDDWEKFEMVLVGGPGQRFPNDANFSALWGMHHYDDKDIDAPEAWKIFTGEFSAGIVVAVIDTGIDYNHEDLRENMWRNPNEIPGNGIDDDSNGYIDDIHGVDFANEDGDPMDDQLHGTHCAGTIAGVGNNGLGVTGVAWHGVRLMALKFLNSAGDGRTSDAVKAIDYAVAHGARILSNSWGGTGSSAAMRAAIERAEAAGVLFMAAAGNAGTDNDVEPNFPSNYPSDGIIAVASTTHEGELSGFSCYGATTVDLAAPGSGIYSTVPHQRYRSLSGTSMATPHVSGVAALVWMYRPALEMAQVKELLLASVRPSPALEGKVRTGGCISAKRALQAASALEPPHPPAHAPRGLAFEDVDPRVGMIAGIVTITAALDESDVEYYKVYFVSYAGFQLDFVGNVPATGDRLLEVAIPEPVVLPQFAAGFVAVSGNASGEMPAQLGGKAPNATLEDYGLPKMGPQAAVWEGDVDLRTGYIAGSLRVSRAADESSISHYNVYWSDGRGEGPRGPLLGSIPAIGFHEANCTGPSCSVIERTAIAGGHRFERRDYLNNEEATIAASGPGTLRITRFETEEFYDVLYINGQELSGLPEVPLDLEMPAGPQSIFWQSDSSATATGWTFDLIQNSSRGELRVSAAKPLGRGLEVVPAYGKSELPEGVFAEVVDYNRTMPPSPGFAPVAVRFIDLDPAEGAIAGVAEVTPAPDAARSGAVARYRLDFADAAGRLLGKAAEADVEADGNESSAVRVPLAGALPAGAAWLAARAANRFGLSAGQALAELQDLRAPTANGTEATGPGAARGERGPRMLGAPAAPERVPEPWLQPREPANERRVVWPAEGSAGLLAAGRARHGRVLGSVTVPGLEARAVGARARAAVAGAVAAALPHAEAGNVQIRRVVTIKWAVGEAGRAGAAGARGKQAARPAGRRAGRATAVDFAVEPADGTPAVALDRIEARLILLGMGGALAERFNQGLLTALGEAGATLPEGTRAEVAEPQQVLPLSRTLAAVAPDPEESLLAEAADERTEEAVLDAAVAGGLAAAFVLAAVVLTYRRLDAKRQIEQQGLRTAVLESVHVQPQNGVAPSTMLGGQPATATRGAKE